MKRNLLVNVFNFIVARQSRRTCRRNVKKGMDILSLNIILDLWLKNIESFEFISFYKQ